VKHEISVPPSWKALEALSGTVILIGASDRGKSTLARWLVSSIAGRGSRTGWIDGDVGQSTLGLPTTINLSVADSQEEPVPFARFFVGSTTPRGHMLPLLVGLQRLAEAARECDSLVIDTDGLVAAEAGGSALKEWQIELLRPDAVVAIQNAGELEPILGPLRRRSDLPLHILSPASQVNRRSPEVRIRRRNERFRSYFEGASALSFPFSAIPVYGLEKACTGRLLSLQDDRGLCLALGVISSVHPARFEIITPLEGLSPVAALRLGDLRLNPETGEEI
jgi:polynucleotide 5'-hydroxyl-kinase GRC3/NOL9